MRKASQATSRIPRGIRAADLLVSVGHISISRIREGFLGDLRDGAAMNKAEYHLCGRKVQVFRTARIQFWFFALDTWRRGLPEPGDSAPNRHLSPPFLGLRVAMQADRPVQ